MMVMLWVFVYARTYLKPIGLGVLIFAVAIIAYVEAWNMVVAYDLVPASVNGGSSGMVTITTTILTTSTISNTTTVYNETVTATMCPPGVTSCSGMGEHMDVIVNRPVIPGVYILTIPVYWSRMSPPYLSFYHDLAYGAIIIITITWTTLGILGARRKEQAKRPLARRAWQ